MKKLLLFICAAMMIFSCGKEESGNKPSIDTVDKVTWATVVKAYPFLEGFPVFDGEVENWQHEDIDLLRLQVRQVRVDHLLRQVHTCGLHQERRF